MSVPRHIDPPPAHLADGVARIAARLLDDLEPLLAEMDRAALEAGPAFGADATLAAEVRASDRANATRLLVALSRHPDRPISTEVPQEALDVARTLVRRGLELEPLFHAYRMAQNTAWRRWMHYADEEARDHQQFVELLDACSAIVFAYVDAVLTALLDQVHREREELLGGALARRRETVRLLLDGAPLDVGQASRRLGYELARTHVAVVLWADRPAVAHGALERTALALARAAGAHRPLTLDAGAAALWAWFAPAGQVDEAGLRAAMRDAPAGVLAAAGPADDGPLGFRRSHDAAVAVQRLVATGPRAADRLTTFRDIEVVALLDHDDGRAAGFVAATLGPLAADDEPTARLRATARVYLQEAAHAPHAAARLHVHRNTVLQRVARAEELLGHPLGERRLAVMLALEIDHWLGPTARSGSAPGAGVRRPSPGRSA